MGLNGYIQSLYRGIRERSSDFRSDVFKQLYLPLPPLEEQQTIVAYIEEKCKKIDALVEALEAEIEQLKEYKQSLISDCVTGKIKV
jgi:type I restriction enzyme S subunit